MRKGKMWVEIDAGFSSVRLRYDFLTFSFELFSVLTSEGMTRRERHFQSVSTLES